MLEFRARVALVVVLVLLFIGLFRVSINGDPSQLVASTSDRYQAYVSRLEQFPSEQLQLLVFTQADVLDAEHLRRYQSVLKPLGTLPQVSFVGSLFSPPLLSNALRRIISDADTGSDSGIVEDVKALLQQDDYLPGRMVSPSLTAAQMSITLVSTEAVKDTIKEIESILSNAYPEDSGIRWSLAGNPMVEQAIKRDVVQELLHVTLVALLFGAVVAAWAVRNLKSVMILLCVPTMAVIGTVGLMGWMGVSLTLLSQAVLLVVFLVVFTDTLHAIRGGRGRKSLIVACSLTSVTTGAAAIALWFASSVVIQQFAIALLAGIAVGFCVWVLWLVGFSHNENSAQLAHWKGVKPWSLTLKETSFTHAKLVCGIISFGVLLFFASQLKTGFSITENLPKSNEVASTLSLAEEQFSGYLPLQLLLSPSDASLTTEHFIEQLAQFQQALNESMISEATATAIDTNTNTVNTTAKETVASAGDRPLRWFSLVDVLGLTPGEAYEQRLSYLPPPLLSTLWREGNQVVLFAPESVTQWLQNSDDAVVQLDEKVQQFADEFQLQAGPVTGMPVLVSEASDSLFGDAWRSVLLTLLVLGFAVGAVLKSYRLSGLAALPVVFSMAGFFAVLVILGEPLRHAGVVMMTLVIGLSVDNALHLLVSSQHEKNKKLFAIEDCLTVLHLATLSSIAGFIALAFSDIPSVAVLGFATSAALGIGFVATALLLPPTLLKPD